MRIVFFDNYDSFTFNLVHYFQEIGAEVNLLDQEAANLHPFISGEADALVVGPGPKTPAESGPLLTYMSECIRQNIPILGVCLGHQALGELLGLSLQRAAKPMHGKSSILTHSGTDIFANISNPMQVGRYHSLIVQEANNAGVDIEVLMRDELGQIMAFRHINFPFWGIQFHPESVLTPEGKVLLKNWMDLVGFN